MTYLPPPTPDLSLLFCFLLLAPIFYVFGKYSNTSYRDSQSPAPNSMALHSPGQCRCRKEIHVDRDKSGTCEDTEAEFRKRREEMEAILAECKFVAHDMKREKEVWRKEWERDREEYRKEQIKWLWDGKKRGEQGARGWLVFGGGKKQKTEKREILTGEVLPGIEC
jgi:hypothetical protein